MNTYIGRFLIGSCASLAVLVPVTSANAASDSVIDPTDAAALADAGITLAPEERDASIVVASQPGQVVRVTFRPEGCDAADCENVVVAEAPPTAAVGPLARAATARTARKAFTAPKVRAINGATVVKVTVKRSSPKAAARAYAPQWIRVMGDTKCGDSLPGCATWLLSLNSRAYYDGDWAWGTRSRRSVAGAVDCNETRANGGSWSDRICAFYNDPSATALYAKSEGQINAWGGIASKVHWLHRHYNKDGGTWLVTS